MEQRYAPGSIVYLKSGGPPLTVSGITRTDDIIDVEWFAGDELKRDGFHPECLRRDDERPRRVLDFRRVYDNLAVDWRD